jgi:hypothetical protein
MKKTEKVNLLPLKIDSSMNKGRIFTNSNREFFFKTN